MDDGSSEAELETGLQTAETYAYLDVVRFVFIPKPMTDGRHASTVTMRISTTRFCKCITIPRKISGVGSKTERKSSVARVLLLKCP